MKPGAESTVKSNEQLLIETIRKAAETGEAAEVTIGSDTYKMEVEEAPRWWWYSAVGREWGESDVKKACITAHGSCRVYGTRFNRNQLRVELQTAWQKAGGRHDS